VTATTIGDLVDRIRPRLDGAERPRLNTLDTSVDDSTTSIIFDYSSVRNEISPGDYIEIGTEIMYVWSVSATTAIVLRGARGSTAAAHTAGDLIRVRPRFFDFEIVQHLEDEILSWPDDVFSVTTTTVSIGNDYNSVVAWSPTRFRQLLSTRAVITSSGVTTMPEVDAWVIENSGQFSTHGLKVINKYQTSITVEVTYAQGFDTSALDALATTLADVGLATTMHDIVMFGVLWRVMSAAMAERSDIMAARDPGPDDVVTERTVLNQIAAFRQLRDNRLDDERRRLREQYLPGF
jgi:hypothetical protein